MTEKTIPALRFDGFDGEWQPCSVGGIATIGSGRDYKHLGPGDIPVYGTGGYMLSVNEALSQSRDAIGIGRKGTIDKPYILRAPFWTVDTLFYVVPNSVADLHFLQAQFERVDWQSKDESTGVPSLSKETISSTDLNHPTTGERQRIGALFSELDALIGQHRRKHEQLQQTKVALMQRMFPQADADEPELRVAGFSGAWESHRLGDLGTTYGGLTGKSKDDFGHGEARYVTYLEVFQHARILDSSRCGAVEIDQKQNEVKWGDALFTVSSETPEEVGMSAVWFGTESNVYLNSFCFGFRPSVELDRPFFAHVLRSRSVRVQLELLAQGISRFNISKNKAMDITIQLPSAPEQEAIGSFFSQLDDLISAEQQYISKLQQVKSALLQQMFV